MKKASGFYADSLEMLLDTMCNILGGVVFITLTLAVLVRNAPSKTAPDTSQSATELTNQLAAVTRSNALLEAELTLTLQHLQTPRTVPQTNLMRLPVQHITGKESWYVIIDRGQLYPVQFYSATTRDHKAKNTRTLEWRNAGGGAQEALPKPAGGLDPDTGLAEMVQSLRHNSMTNFYLAFLVKEDSFAAFNHAKETADSLGFQYGWEPYALNEPFVLGGRGEGQSILPQN